MKTSLALLLALAGGVATVRAANVTIESASLSFDPNALHWYVTSKVCNASSGGYSGSLLYELRLLNGSRYWFIGSEKSTKNLDGGKCREIDRMNIQVNTNVPRGTYEIQFLVSEYDGGKYVIRDKTTFSKVFLKGGGQP